MSAPDARPSADGATGALTVRTAPCGYTKVVGAHYDICDAFGRVVAMSLSEPLAHQLARAPDLERQVAQFRGALTDWLAIHDEGMRSREDAERVWHSGRLTVAVDAARAALAAAAGGPGSGGGSRG